MTLKKAYISLLITVILMVATMTLYAFDVTKLTLQWGLKGIALSSVVSITAVSFNIYSFKNKNAVEDGFWGVRKHELLDWLTFLTTSVTAIFIIFTFFFLSSGVSQHSMYPTLKPGERILVSHFMFEPQRGDIVIIEITRERYPLVAEENYVERNDRGVIIKRHDRIFHVKRLVGMPGDLILFVSDPNQINRFLIVINGQAASAPNGDYYYIESDQKQIINKSVLNNVLIEGKFLAFGDNANGFTVVDPVSGNEKIFPGSADSRAYGAINYEDIIGRVIFRLWPIGDIDG